MAVLMTLEFEASVEDYDKVSEKLGEELPDGAIVHAGVDLGGKMKVVDVWESQEKFEKFVQEKLGPAIAEVLGTDGPQPSPPTFEEIHDLQVNPQ